MNAESNFLRAELARRIRTISPPEWQEFSNLWMAFNAIYGGEPDRKERARVIASIRRNLNNSQALKVLRSIPKSVDRLLSVPPGNMMIEAWNPAFRTASQRYAAMYQNKNETPVSRLAAVAAVLYQIRCNLIHGSKDPQVERDRILVAESLIILRLLVPVLEESCLAAA